MTPDFTTSATPAAEKPVRLQCRHIRTDGHRCGSPALRSADFCFYHHNCRKPIPKGEAQQRQTERNRRAAFVLPNPEDRSAIQEAIGQVLLRLAANELDPKRAGLLLYGLQIASCNLPRLKEQPDPATTVEEVEEHPEQGLIALPQDITKSKAYQKSLAEILEEQWAKDDARNAEREAKKAQQAATPPAFTLDLNAEAEETAPAPSGTLNPPPSTLHPSSLNLSPEYISRQNGIPSHHPVLSSSLKTTSRTRSTAPGPTGVSLSRNAASSSTCLARSAVSPSKGVSLAERFSAVNRSCSNSGTILRPAIRFTIPIGRFPSRSVPSSVGQTSGGYQTSDFATLNVTAETLYTTTKGFPIKAASTVAVPLATTEARA